MKVIGVNFFETQCKYNTIPVQKFVTHTHVTQYLSVGIKQFSLKMEGFW